MINIAYELELGYQLPLTWRHPVKKPIVAVRISVGTNYQDTLALVDSGADYSIFYAEFAEVLGLKLTDGRLIRLIGLDNKQYPGYLHPIAIRLLDAPSSWSAIPAQVIFRENHPKRLGNLLGRRDFFRALRLGFDEGKRTLYLGRA